MTPKRTAKKTSRFVALKIGMVIMAVVVVVSFMALGSAQGSGSVSSDTVGIGQEQSTQTKQAEVAPSSKIAVETDELSRASSSADALAHPSARTIVVADPDPVVAIAAVDASNPEAVAQATKIGTANPLPTAPRIAPDTSGPGWKTGVASAYDLDTNQGWDATATGVKLSPESVTVAVPESQDYLLGSVVEIVYNDKVVVATITDTGGFEKYGRALDLAGGVWKAFGATTWGEWGIRTVSYRFL